MPKLIWSSETFGCGATIELDNKEVIILSIAQTGILVRRSDMQAGFIKRILSSFFGPKLYNEQIVYKNARTARALSVMFPQETSALNFHNPFLGVFANAIWHCSSAAQVSIILNGACCQAPELDNEDTAVIQQAFEAARNWPPTRGPEMTPATYQVIYSDGITQEN